MTKDSSNRPWAFATKAVHVGQRPDALTGAVIPPIYTSTTFVQERPGCHRGYYYSRSGNPNRSGLEACAAALEDGAVALAFASGLAAITAILETLPPGATIVANDDLYGGTVRLFEQVKSQSQGLAVRYVDLRQAANLEAVLDPAVRLIWVETPTNPLLKIIDLAGVAAIARRWGITSVCDNTFASPYLQQPLQHGFDLVVHSATKYLNGHSDVIAGLVICAEDNELSARLRFLQNSLGAVPSPFDCHMIQRGLKTLPLRMQQHCRSARAVAEYLQQCPAIERVIYPGLPSHPQYELAQRQMAAGGGIVTCQIRGGLDTTIEFLSRLRLFALAESLGGVESLVDHPALMTHAAIPAARRQALGIADGLIRLSVGIEDTDDLLADLEQAFLR